MGSSAAACLLFVGDTEIDFGFFQYLGCRSGQLLHLFIIARETADMIVHIHFFLGGIFQVQSLGPGGPFSPGARHHGALFPETGHNLFQGRMGLAVLNALDPEFIDRLKDFHVHGIVARYATAATHLAVIDDVEEFIRIIKPVLQHRRSNVQSSTA